MASKKTHHKTSETCAGGVFSKPWKSSDLVLSVENRKFHVHRTLLAVASPVFERMFSSDFKEKDASEIPLPGKTAGDIEELLKFIYPEKDFTLTRKNCFGLFKLATEYQMELLRKQCENLISDWCRQMDMDKAIEVVVLSQTFPLEVKIIDRCITIISTQRHKAWPEVKQHRLFSQLKPEFVQRLVEERMEYLERELNIGKAFYSYKDLRKCESRFRFEKESPYY